MEVYGLRTCDSCRKAKKALEGAGRAFEMRDVREDGVPKGVLEQAEAQFGAALMNTRSTTWRGLDAQARCLPVLQLIEAHPTLMKRPLIVEGAQMTLGWGPEAQE